MIFSRKKDYYLESPTEAVYHATSNTRLISNHTFKIITICLPIMYLFAFSGLIYLDHKNTIRITSSQKVESYRLEANPIVAFNEDPIGLPQTVQATLNKRDQIPLIVPATPKPSPAINQTKTIPWKEIVFGYSVQGKPIKGFEFGTGQETILLFGSIHGKEKGTYILLNNTINAMKRGELGISDNKKVVIIPTINPDGLERGTDKLNANGVNLNLNFSTSGWKEYGGENNEYAGKEPFSEPESRTLRDITYTYNFSKMISYHTKGSLVNPELFNPSIDLAKWYARISGYKYYADIKWDYPGTATKWFAESLGRPAITVELSEHMSSDWNINKRVIAELLK